MGIHVTRSLRLPVVLAAILCAVVLGSLWNRAQAVNRLLAAETGPGRETVRRLSDRWYSGSGEPLSADQVSTIAADRLQRARQEIIDLGALAGEADQVLGSAKARFQDSTMAIPVHVSRGSAWTGRAWAITLAWESRDIVNTGGAPVHFWSMVIEGKRPWRILAEEHCG